MNLTANWEMVPEFLNGADGKKVIRMAVDGTKQLFEVNFPGFDLHCDPCKPNYKWILMSMKL
jgi:hypothetical protein